MFDMVVLQLVHVRRSRSDHIEIRIRQCNTLYALACKKGNEKKNTERRRGAG